MLRTSYQSGLGDPPTKKYINPSSSFQSMVKSYEQKLPPPHKRILPRRPKKKRRLEKWELRKDNTQISKGGHRKKM